VEERIWLTSTRNGEEEPVGLLVSIVRLAVAEPATFSDAH
jgi:hypothetical protein